MLNGTVCTSAFCQGHALLRVCLWQGDSQLWGTANILTPGVKKSQVCNGILRAIAPTVLQAAKLIPMLPLDSHGRISVGRLFNSWPKT